MPGREEDATSILESNLKGNNGPQPWRRKMFAALVDSLGANAASDAPG